MSVDDDRAFLERFRAAAIPPDEWNHEAHLRMAFLHLGWYEFGDAVRRIRRGIRRLNRANGIADSETGFLVCYSLTGQRLWKRLVGAPVRALVRADLTGDGRPEIAVGTDRGAVIVFDAEWREVGRSLRTGDGRLTRLWLADVGLIAAMADGGIERVALLE